MTQRNTNDIIAELENSDQYRVTSLIYALDSSIRIMKSNYSELSNHINNYQNLNINKSFIDRNFLNKLELQNFLNETQRLIHNYVTSTQSLIDHQRRHQRSLAKIKDAFNEEYQTEIDNQFIQDPLSNFIGELRNYYNHYAIATISSNKVFDGITNELSAKLVISLESIKETSFNWNQYSKSYLNQSDSQKELSKLFEEYHLKVLDFQKWYKNRLEEIFHSEIEFVEIRRKELASKEINLLFQHIESKKGFNRLMVENIIFKYLDIDHTNEILEEGNPKQKADLILNAFSRFTNVPPLMFVMIASLYGAFDKN